jgi:hypothetical protein
MDIYIPNTAFFVSFVLEHTFSFIGIQYEILPPNAKFPSQEEYACSVICARLEVKSKRGQ